MTNNTLVSWVQNKNTFEIFEILFSCGVRHEKILDCLEEIINNSIQNLAKGQGTLIWSKKTMASIRIWRKEPTETHQAAVEKFLTEFDDITAYNRASQRDAYAGMVLHFIFTLLCSDKNKAESAARHAEEVVLYATFFEEDRESTKQKEVILKYFPINPFDMD